MNEGNLAWEVDSLIGDGSAEPVCYTEERLGSVDLHR